MLGKEMTYEILTCQMQYGSANKESDQINQWRVQFIETLTNLDTLE